jgi:NAD(P)-dependent dehydrogenase (short-subunit alcohol dehydrogenase family)
MPAMSDVPRRIVLTGAARGLGLAMTERFVDAGQTVLGCARRPEGVAELRKRFPAPHRFDVVDVRQEEQVRSWAARLLVEGEAPDLLINNAALMNQLAPLWEIPAEEMNDLLQVNVLGVHRVIRYFVPAMIQRRAGVVVNFSSGWGRSVSPNVAPYCATKYAIEGLTLALAQELPTGMAAIPLNPGIIDTDMLRTAFAEGAGEYPSPQTWARRAVPFLLHLGAKDNGRSLTVPDDGGA